MPLPSGVNDGLLARLEEFAHLPAVPAQLPVSCGTASI